MIFKLILLVFLSISGKAQKHETNYWTRYASGIEFNRLKISSSLEDRVAFDGGQRRSLLANVVLLYKLRKDATIGLGFAHFTTYDDQKNGLSIPELRPFQQFKLKNSSGNFNFDHRLRAEERFKRDTLGTGRLHSYSYTLRMRYRFELTWSLIKKQKQKGHFGVQLKDEIFISAGNIAENYDQNRLYGGFVYQMSKPLGLEVGYMWVNRNQIDAEDQNIDLVRITIRHDIEFE